ncbi:Xaa-Pro peptidase family protein [Mesorhizobium sp.]|uniref:M24 family metallopeptidase n=1 Tax=Mesorhizobium sp. TaxID=1871066 RepID=UPI000FE7A767|nr:Xaa-Pro peptidase family protein [Mesorhizobium sp.]RWB69694.1 MAG: aminopeptidase P family protein [Mesorhizobium sp.]
MQFQPSEILSRIERLRSELRMRKLDALLIDDGEATSYFAGFETSLTFYRAGLIPLEGEAFFVLRSLDVAPMRERSWIKDLVGFRDWEHPVSAFANKVRERGFDHSRIGIDLSSHALSVQTFEALKRELPNVEFIDVDGLPWKMRMIKSSAELEKLRKASAVNDATMEEIINAARPGITEREAARMAVEAYVRHGGDPGHHGVITAGRGWDFLHGHLHDVPLREGDVLHLELIPRYDGYASRMMRCVVLGEVPEALRRLSDKMIALQDKQITAMRPGAKAKDIDRIMRQGALEAGIREQYTNVTGYTLGFYPDYMIRASDFTWAFLPNSAWTLDEGMVFHMYTSAGGIAISETVLVSPSGGERLTKMDRKLYSSAETK